MAANVPIKVDITVLTTLTIIVFFNASNKVVLLNSLPYHSKVNPSNKIFNGEVLKEKDDSFMDQKRLLDLQKALEQTEKENESLKSSVLSLQNKDKENQQKDLYLNI